jgi:hypothetical protein
MPLSASPTSDTASVANGTPRASVGGFGRLHQVLMQTTSSWFVSAVFHTVVVVLLALLVIPIPTRNLDAPIAVMSNETPSVLEGSVGTGDSDPAELPSQTSDLQSLETIDPIKLTEPKIESPIATSQTDPPRPTAEDWPTVPKKDLLTHIGGFASGGGLDGRTGYRKHRATEYGATMRSEAAVERGLEWLAAHQRADGSWNFDHQNETCKGHCGNPGSFASTTAATGLALLPFLGAGNTHQKGVYRENVQKGVYFLGSKMILSEKGGDLHQSNMYAQGIATIALCECYAMTKDASLKPYAQSAVDFILNAQDKHGGGWRYAPLQPGDTTVTGWQVMALRSGELAGLRVPTPALSLVEKFLDRVQSDEGAKYGYQDTDPTRACSAIGLLCRIFLGWPREQLALMRAVSRYEKQGPHKTDMYSNYNATQVMHHVGGSPWLSWNKRMRDYLLSTQATAGHENGSWYFVGDEHGKVGGRLYTTCLAIMTLEVYYRYLPIYEHGAK